MSQAGDISSVIGPVPPEVPTSFVEDVGSAVPVANILNILGGVGIDTSGAGNTVTITFDGTEVPTIPLTFTEDTGSAQAALNNLNILGGTGIDTSGAGSTVTITFDASEVPTLLQTVTTQDGTATTAANNLNYNGYITASGSSIGTTHAAGSTFQYEDRTYLSEFVVDPSATVGVRGTYATIQAAITAAPSGSTIFIRPGTYTEDLTLKAGVSLQGFDASAAGQATIILGNATATFAGTCNISGLTLRTNSAPFLTVSGSSATIVNIYDSYLDVLNNNGISHTSSTAGSQINIRNCNGNIGTTGITPFVSTSAGGISWDNTEFGNSGGSTTASTTSVQIVAMSYCSFPFPISATGTGSFIGYYSNILTSVTAVTTAGTGISSFNVCYISGLTASAVSIGAGTTVGLNNCTINSSNANAITGAGTLAYTTISFDGTSSAINTTTLTKRNTGVGNLQYYGSSGTTGTVVSNTMTMYEEGTFTPTLDGAVSGITTYSNQVGFYTKVGNMAYVSIAIVITAATGTGNAIIGGLPFTIRADAVNGYSGTVNINGAGWGWPVGTTTCILRFLQGSSTAIVTCTASTVPSANLQMANAPLTLIASGIFLV